jgi:hypothetical protein
LRAAGGDSQISLGWDDFSPAPDLAGYRVYSSTTASGPFTLHTTVAAAEYLDLSVTNATTYYYRVTAFDTGSNESTPSNVASAQPDSISVEYPVVPPGGCSGPPDCSPATGQPNGTALELDPGDEVILDFGLGNGIIDGSGYDMVFYEFPNAPGVLMDYITIDVSADNVTWYTVFVWDGALGGVSGTNIDSYAADGEVENEPIPSTALYPPPAPPPDWNTGIAIDIDPWTPAGYSFRYVRLRDGGGTDPAQIDALRRLN